MIITSLWYVFYRAPVGVVCRVLHTFGIFWVLSRSLEVLAKIHHCQDLDLWNLEYVSSSYFFLSGISGQEGLVSYVSIQKMGDPWPMSLTPTN
jgi:hypothetical protein